MAHTFTEENYEELVLKSDKPAVVDFGAEWCGPCKALSPIIDEMAVEYEGKAIIGKVDVDNAPSIAARYGVRNIPTVIFVKNGELVDKQVGSATKSALTAKLNALLS
jgi:thioredoxin 1